MSVGTIRKKYVRKWFPPMRKHQDPKFRCAYILHNGKRCTRKTTTIFCKQHAELLNANYVDTKGDQRDRRP